MTTDNLNLHPPPAKFSLVLDSTVIFVAGNSNLKFYFCTNFVWIKVGWQKQLQLRLGNFCVLWSRSLDSRNHSQGLANTFTTVTLDSFSYHWIKVRGTTFPVMQFHAISLHLSIESWCLAQKSTRGKKDAVKFFLVRTWWKYLWLDGPTIKYVVGATVIYG